MVRLRSRMMLALLAVLALCGGCSVASASSADVYTIGLITSRTGQGSQLGVGELRGARMAVQRINSHGGVHGNHVELRVADDQSKPSQAVLQARRMIGHVDALVGSSLSGSCRAIVPLARSAHLVDYCLSPGVHPHPGGWQWSASADTADLAERIVRYWHSQGITRIGLAYTTDASGVDGAEAVHHAIEKVGGATLTGQAAYDTSAVSATSQLQKLAAGKPQALVVWASGSAAAVAFKGIRQMGLHLPVATTNANLTYTFLQRTGANLPETLLIPATRDFWWRHSHRGPEAEALERYYHHTYRSRYGEPPDFGPGVAFDAVTLVARALGAAHGKPEQARTALQRVHGAVGVVGTYSFGRAAHRGLSIADVGLVRANPHSFSYVGR